MSDEMKPMAWCNPLEAYADSYAQMSRDGDGRVDCRSVEVDIRQNMMPVVAALEAERDAYRDMAARKSTEKVAEFHRANAAERERDEALAANERDRSEIMTLCNSLDDEIKRRSWLIGESRGSYEWDDDRYREEFKHAIEAIADLMEPLRKIGRNLRNCPTDADAIKKARATAAETALAEAQARSAGNWRNLQRLWALARGDDPDGDPDDRPRCRDCADNFNVCPDTGLSCDPQIATEQRLRGLAEAKAEVERLREYFDAAEDLLSTGLAYASVDQFVRRDRARAVLKGGEDA